MDEFGVFVESYGVKVQGGKSTPMANMKARNNSNNGFPSNLGFNSGQKSDSGNFRSKVYDDNDIFGNSNNLDIESVLGGSTNNKNMYDDFDLFGVGTRKSDSVDDLFGAETRKSDSVDDLFGVGTKKSDSVDDLFGAETRKSDSVDDLLGAETRKSDSVDDLLGVGTKKSGSVDDLFGNFGLESDRHPAGKRLESDDLIPGFGDFSSPTYGKKTDQKSPQQSNSSKSSSSSPDDPFLVFESSTSKANDSWAFSESSEQNPGISSVTSSIDELEDFANFKVRGGTTEQPHVPKKDSPVKKPVDRTQDKSKNVRVTINKPSKTTKPKSAAEGHMSAGLHEKGRPEEKKSSLSKKNISPVKNFVDDLMSFGDSVPSSEAFQEVEDESEERRNARFKQHMRTQERMAKALAEKTQRDLQSQNEQEEKHRLAETLNYDIKRWATGKEGNLRALLSSLQHVLWPECGWQPVSLTDLITSTSVKKIYHKATLCVHPDKVQQKGATIRQKYIAEKVFDLLKEAWNKFNTEELR